MYYSDIKRDNRTMRFDVQNAIFAKMWDPGTDITNRWIKRGNEAGSEKNNIDTQTSAG